MSGTKGFGAEVDRTNAAGSRGDLFFLTSCAEILRRSGERKKKGGCEERGRREEKRSEFGFSVRNSEWLAVQMQQDLRKKVGFLNPCFVCLVSFSVTAVWISSVSSLWLPFNSFCSLQIGNFFQLAFS